VAAAVTLTPEESRRLIAKALAGMDVVKKAMREGTIGLAMCSSAAFVAEELLGHKVNRDLYCCGFIHEDGWCWVHPETRGTEAHGPNPQGCGQILLRRGAPTWLDYPRQTLADHIEAMGPGDIIVKSGNVLDREGKVGVLVGDLDGGEAGRYLPFIQRGEIISLVPMTISKALPVRLERITAGMGTKAKVIDRKRTYGVACGMLPWPGTVVTEIEAFKWLAGAEALPIAAGGFDTGAGCVSFLLQGPEENVDQAWRLVREIKGEPRLRNLVGQCKTCEVYAAESCSARRKFSHKRGS